MALVTRTNTFGRQIFGVFALLTLQQFALAQPTGPLILADPGQLVAMPPPGTPSLMKLPDYDQDDDQRNDWSKKEFPQHGECRWLATQWGGKPGEGAKVSAAERQAIKAEQEKIIAALQKAPVVSPPVGFCSMVVSAGSDDAVDVGFALRSSFMMANRQSNDWERNKPNGRLVYGEITHLIFTFNEIPIQSNENIAQFGALDAQGLFFSEDSPPLLFQGFPVYGAKTTLDGQAHFLVIPRNNRPLYRAVNVGRVIRWQLTQFDEELKRLQAMIDSAKREYDGYVGPKAQAGNDEIIAKRIERQKAITPEQRAKVRANYEAEVRDSTEALRKRWDIESDTNHPFNVATRRKAEAQARPKTLSPADAKMPACLIKREQVYITPDIGAVGDAKCAFNLIEANPDYYDRNLPRSAIQLVTVSRFAARPPVGGLPGSRYRNFWANQHMMWGLDWQKIRQDVLGAKEPFDVAAVLPFIGKPLPTSTLTAMNDAPPPATRTRDDGAAAAKSTTQLTSANESTSANAPDSSGVPSITTSRSAYVANQPIEVRYNGMPGGKKDWITIAPAGAPEQQYGEWTYLNGQKSGTHVFTRALKTGSYEVRAFETTPTSEYNLRARATFEVR